jgi:hypothetical protein
VATPQYEKGRNVNFTSVVNMTPLYIMGGIFVLLALCCLLPERR